MPKMIYIRCYEELNEFLPYNKRKTIFSHTYSGTPDIKDILESLGIPHTEIELIIVSGKSVDFVYKPDDGDLISVYPVFESLDVKPLIRLRPKPLRESKFIADVHLGKLCRYLRLFGFDTYYRNDLEDQEIIHLSQTEHRIILTRDVGILKNGKVTHGLYIRSQNPKQQLKEVIQRLNLQNQIHSFTICLHCNGNLHEVPKEEVIETLEEKTKKYYNEFYRCTDCGKVYWQGSHYERMKAFLADMLPSKTENSGKVGNHSETKG